MLTAVQELLLKSALLPPDQALTHWLAWLRLDAVSPETFSDRVRTLDADAQRLLPLIYRNLEFTAAPLLPQLRGHYLHTWRSNHNLLHMVYPVLKRLQAEGFEVMLLKGLPLALRFYRDLGVRPTADVDLLVPTHQAEAALALLTSPELGFRPTRYEFRHRRHLHAIHLLNREGRDLDLHWNLVSRHIYPGADAPHWASKQPLVLPNGQSVYSLSATHQIFHNLVHGFRWNEEYTIRWIPDTYQIYRQADDIDWSALLDLAEQYQMRIPVKTGLDLLRDLLGMELPATAADRLARLAPTPAEQRYLRLLTPVKNPLHKGVRFLQKHYLAYQLFGPRKSPLDFPAYLLSRFRQRVEWSRSDTYHLSQTPPPAP